MMDAQIELNGEECASGMEQRGNCAALKDAQIELNGVECAIGMGQRGKGNHAAS